MVVSRQIPFPGIWWFAQVIQRLPNTLTTTCPRFFQFLLLFCYIFFSFSSRIFKHIQHLLIQSQQKSTIKKSEICSKLTIKTSERCLVSFGFFRVRINVNILDREKNGPKPTAGRKHFAFRDAIIVINIIWIETINSRWKQSTKHHLFTLQRWSQ